MSEFVQGFQTTEGEKKYDYKALGNLPDLSITTDKITKALGFAPQSEEQVKAEVKVASDAAAAADSKAAAADKKAVDAQTTANQAVGAAQQAQSTADDAYKKIDDSQVQVIKREVISVENSAEAPLQNLRIFGKTEQIKTTGKNLLKLNVESSSESGIKTRVNEDGSILIWGTAKSNYISGRVSFEIPPGEYIVSGFTSAENEKFYFTFYDGTDSNGKRININSPGDHQVTITSGHIYDARIVVISGTTLNNVIIYPMIRPASITDPVFEPYTDGISSPSPEYPQELKSVGKGAINTKVKKMNLLGFPYANNSQTLNGINFTVNLDGSVTLKGKATKEALFYLTGYNSNALYLPVGTYYFSGVPSGQFGGNTRPQYYVTNNMGAPAFSVYAEGRKVDITIPGFYRISIDIVANNEFDNVTFFPMVNIGDAPLPYESPEAAQTLALSLPDGLPGIKVSSGGNYTDENDQQWLCDEIDFVRGEYIQRLNRMIIDGDENYVAGTNTNYPVPAVIVIELQEEPDIESVRHSAMCNIATNNRNIATNFAPGTFGISQTKKVAFSFSGVTEDNAVTFAQEYFSQNPATLIYALKTPIYHKLSDIDLDALTQYATLHTNYPNTTILNDAGAEIEVQYATPTTVLPISGGRMNGSIDMVNHQLTGLPTPKNNTDAVSLEYLQETNLELAKGINAVSDIADDAQETADEAVKRIDDSQVQVAKGKVISFGNSADAPLQGLRIFGKTTQNGSPTLETPAPLKSAGDGGMIKTTVCAKNMFDISTVIGNSNIEFETNGNSIHISSKTTGAYHGVQFAPIHFKGGITYTVSGNVDEYVSGSGRFNLRRTDGKYINGFGVINIITPGYYSMSYTPAEDVDAYMAIAVTANTTDVKGDITFSNIQLEVGASATDYEPFFGNTVAVQHSNGLSGIPVTSGGNYTDENDKQWWCDTVNLETGKLERRTLRVVLDGTHAAPAFAKSGDAHHRIWFDVGEFERKAGFGTSGMCSHLPNTSQAGETGWFVTNATEDAYSYVALTLPDSVAGTTETAVRQWLAANPITVVVVRIDIQYEDLSEEELAQYASLHTYYPNTTVFNDGGVVMKVQYATPTSVLPIIGGAVSRLEIPTPTKSNEAANKDYVDKNINTVRDIISSFHSNIVQEASGEVIQVHGSAEAPLAGLKVFGKTEQKSTTGKNLFPPTTSRLNDGIDFAVQEDGRIIANGTSENNNTLYVPFTFLANTRYCLSGAPQIAGCTTVAYKDGVWLGAVTDTGYGTTWLQNNTKEGLLAVRVAAGTACTNVVFKPQLELGSTATAYEPYTGGKPSPSPEYPQELESVGDSVNVTVCGKNLLDVSKFTNQIYSAEGVLTNSTNHKLFDYIPVKKGDVFTLSAAYKGTTAEYLRWALFDVNKLFISRCGGAPKAETATVNISQDGYIRVFIAHVEYDVNTLQLEAGSAATAYESYKATTVTVTPKDSSGNSLYLPGIPVESGGNYTDHVTKQQWICDEVDFEKGVYVQRVGKTNMTNYASLNFAISATGIPYIDVRKASDGITNGFFLCNCYRCLLPNESATSGNVRQYSNAFTVFDNTFTSLESAKEKLEKLGFECLYQLAKEKPIPLSEIDPDALAQYAALHSNYPNTTVFNDKNTGMEVKYVADTKLYVDKKFEELAEIIINKL